ncbi:MAG: hypothetical protein U9Q80_00440 [Bacillota bacterium]|nr:hypothetical protein [Bacillota bacterium]
MNRKLYMPILLLIVAILATSCTEKPMVQETTNPQLKIFELYSELFKTDPEFDEIEAFLNKNLDDCDSKYHDTMLIAFEEFMISKLPKNKNKLSVNLIDYTKLTQYSSYASAELDSYFKILETEYLSKDLNSDVLSEVVNKLLDRTVDVENHLLRFKGGRTESKMYELYVRYLYAALMGNGNHLTFIGIDSTKIDDEVLSQYHDFINDYPDSHTASLVKHYIGLLEQTDYNLESEQVRNFHFDFYSNIRSFLWENKAS